MKKLHKIFSHSFPHRIWRIVPGRGIDELAIEERNDQTSAIRLYRYRSGKELQPVPAPDMPWWSTLVSFHSGIFLIRSYGSEGNASGQSLAGLDAQTGKKVWEKENVQILEEEPGRIRLTGSGPSWLDVRSGEPGDDAAMNETVSENKEVVFPFRYTKESPYFQTVSRFLQKQGLPEPGHAIDYLEFDHFLLMAGYTGEGNHLDCDLQVFTLEGKHVFGRKIGEDLPGISDNTFFIYGGNLIFVTSRNDFFEYTLRT